MSEAGAKADGGRGIRTAARCQEPTLIISEIICRHSSRHFVVQICLYILIAFGIFSVAITVGSIVIFKGHKLSGESLALIVERSEVAKLATVVLIILAVTLLGVLKIVAGEAVVAILSGIAGYVFGGKARSSEKERSQEVG